jgi:hypothetical protein
MTNYQQVLSRTDRNQQGLAAILMVLIISSILLTLTLTTGTIGVASIQSALNLSKKAVVDRIGESCVEDTLLKINDSKAIPVNVSLPIGTCNVTINSSGPASWDFTVNSSAGGINVKYNVIATGSGAYIKVRDWKEVQ